MAQPPAYVPAYDFTNWQSSNPADPLPANSIDAEFNAIQTTTDGIRTNLALIQRDDGLLANGSVHKDSFSTAALALIGGTWTPQGDWATATAYAVSDMVEQSNATYVCITAHTSGTFSTDLAAGKWMLFATGGSAANISYDPSTSGLTATNVSAALDELASEINGYLAKSVAGADDVTLSATEIRNGFIKLTGALTGNIDVIVPDDEDGYAVWNATSGAYSLTVKTLAGSGVAVTQGAKADLWCDGTDVIKLSATDDYVAAASVGLVVVSGDDTTPADIETKLLVSGPLSLSTQNGGGNETRTITADVATQGEAEAGTASDVLMTPQRTAQAISASPTNSALKEDIRLLALQVAELSGDRLNMADGIADPYVDATDIDTSLSANELFVTSGGYFIGAADGTTVDGGHTTPGVSGSGNTTIYDRSFALTNGKFVSKLAIYNTVAQTYKLKIGLENSSTDIDTVVDQSIVHTGSGWEEVTLSTPYLVPASGTYRLGSYGSSNSSRANGSAHNIASYSGDATGTGETYSASSNYARFVRATYADSAANLTLVSDAFTADSEPDTARLHVQVKENEAITVNTDLTGEVSRDDGTTWTSATLALVETLADGTKAYEDSSVDISGQPSGTDMRYRIKTLNTKDVEIHGAIEQWA